MRVLKANWKENLMFSAPLSEAILAVLPPVGGDPTSGFSGPPEI